MTSEEMAIEIRQEAFDDTLHRDSLVEIAGWLAERMEARLAKMPRVWRWLCGAGFRYAVDVLRRVKDGVQSDRGDRLPSK